MFLKITQLIKFCKCKILMLLSFETEQLKVHLLFSADFGYKFFRNKFYITWLHFTLEMTFLIIIHYDLFPKHIKWKTYDKYFPRCQFKNFKHLNLFPDNVDDYNNWNLDNHWSWVLWSWSPDCSETNHCPSCTSLQKRYPLKISC